MASFEWQPLRAKTLPALAAAMNQSMLRLVQMLGGLTRVSGGYRVRNSFLELDELAADPDAPDVDRGRVFLRANGAGKTEYCIRFQTGAIQVISTEP